MEFLSETGETQAAFAARLGELQPNVNRWANGERYPSFKRIIEIEALTDGKVGLADWASMRESTTPTDPIEMAS